MPDSLAACELTHLARAPIDSSVARSQHAAYEDALARLGCEIRRVPAAPEHPDSVFIEDTAVVLDEIAIVCRPGAESRRGETGPVAETLAAYRQLRWLSEPASLDGGDVLRLGRTLYVGAGGRTNEAGVSQLAATLRRFDYTVRTVRIHGCLHLKSAVTEIAPGLVLINPAWADGRMFAGHETIEVDPGEPHAANVLRIGDTVLCGAANERTAERLRRAGLDVHPVDVSELAKAEAGLTCCSLIVEEAARWSPGDKRPPARKEVEEAARWPRGDKRPPARKEVEEAARWPPGDKRPPARKEEA
ncbi:MAG: dimethylarginine dimethylaminohydrolase family protein [Vicinamibacterales bacterium]